MFVGDVLGDGGGTAVVPPRTRLETAIAGIWSELLGTERLSVDDDFFQLGGESLTAVQMLAALDELLFVQVDFAEFLEMPTIEALAEAVQRDRQGPADPAARWPGPEPAKVADAGHTASAPCSFAQERLWFVDRLDGATAAYNETRGARIRGEIDADSLEHALQDIVRRHAALRTSFGTTDGVPVQLIAPEPELYLQQLDLRRHADPEAEVRRVAQELASCPFDLERGPLLRAYLLRVGDEDHVFHLVLHHSISDGFSHVVLLRELAELYRAHSRGEQPVLPEPRMQYPAFAERQRSSLGPEALEARVAPWLERLRGAPTTIDLPTDRPRPEWPSYRGACHQVELADSTTAAVRAFARETKATTYATMLATYCVLLHRYSSQEDIVVGATTAGRGAVELEDAIGLFANTVAVRCDVTERPTFRELVGRVRDAVLWAIAHETAPFDQIVARLGLERDLSRHPVFQVFCAHVPPAPLPFDGATAYHIRPAASRFDLTLFVEEANHGGLHLAWEYSTDLFDASTITRMAGHYVALLESALANPDSPVDELRLTEVGAVTASDTSQVPEYPIACLHELFEQHAASTPDAAALTYEGDTLSYGELNARANQLARHLRELGATRETLVALYLEPSVEMIVAVLGVLKAGCAYVPLDPEYPAERAAFVLEDTSAAVLVSQERLLARLPASAQTVCFDRDAAVLAGYGEGNLTPIASPENLAYVIYTSGSTGKPKGVQVEHRHVARLFSATDAWFAFGPTDVWPLLHSYAFDFSVWEIWGALAHGGRLVVSPLWTIRSPQALATLVAEQGVTVMNATPSLFGAIQDELLAVADRLTLRFVVFGGEALQPSALRPWFQHYGEDGPTLVNMYGITETTVHVTYRPLHAGDCDLGSSPIGVQIPDLVLHLLDPRGAPVPGGVVGELFVGGAGVARGYLNRPDLTAERFVENLIGTGRLYRTGDLARRLADGQLEFCGRIDDQVKVRGFRIELGEVQAAVRDAPGVADCAVIATEVAPGDVRLAAYVVPGSRNESPSAEAETAPASVDLTDHLRRALPAYMVPGCIMLIDRLPLTRNGKTDRRALPAPVWETSVDEGFRAPESPTEEVVAEVWRSVLGIEKIGRGDNFFSLGGHSLLAARVATQVRDRRGIAISVRALFEHPTLEDFAAHADSVAASAVDDLPTPAAAPPAGDFAEHERPPLSFQQQALLFFDALEPGNVTYNAALATRVVGDLDLDVLRTALEGLFERHEALRTVLIWDDTTGQQVVLDRFAVAVPVIDLSDLGPEARAIELQRLLREHGRRPFDLSAELMLRTTVFRIGPAESVLLFQPHHVAVDAWAVEIFYRDLAELYAAALEGRPPVLPKLPRQYSDFSRWQRERLRGEFLDRELDFWRAQLAGAPTVLALPTDKRRPPVQTFDGATHTVRLDAQLAADVRALCHAQRVTPYMLLLAVFATLLYRRSGQDDILFGGPMANRDQPGLEDLIGFFANTIVVRAKLGGNPTLTELLRSVRESVLKSYEHQETPLELVVDAVRPQRYPGVNPLFQVNFRVRVGEAPGLSLPGCTTAPVPVDLGLARFDLALELHLLDGALEAEWGWNTDLFERASILRLAAEFESVLRQAVAEPGTRLLGFRLAAEPAVTSAASDVDVAADSAGAIRGFRQGAGRART